MFDFSKVVADINKSANQNNQQSEKTYRYKLVYPSEGKLRVRILFNPASGLVTRLINRHTISNNKVPCMATYTNKSDCPICQVLSQAENSGITVPYSIKSKVRAVCLAQYHSSSYPIDGVKQGDIILLMIPWSVYKGIQKWIQDFSDDPNIMAKVFGSHESNVFIIEHGKEVTDWTSRPDPNVTIMSAKDDEEFANLLESQTSLYELVEHIHEKPTEDDVNLMLSVAEELKNAILTPQKASAPVNASEVQPSSISDTMNHKDNGGIEKPECYGKSYVSQLDTDPTKISQKIKCKLCPHSSTCSTENINELL